MNYFQECTKEETDPAKSVKFESFHPERIREVLEELRGTPEADVIISLILEADVLMQLITRLTSTLTSVSPLHKDDILQDLSLLGKDFFKPDVFH